jgi:ketosteroid isomerase-like protein
MDVRDVIDAYYRLASAGDWTAWCDLFTDDLVMDEQLAGRVEGIGTLRSLMEGFPKMYRQFTNKPLRTITNDSEAAVVSRIEATTSSGRTIDAEVMAYFQLVGDRISYFANYHDTVPFTTALGD